VDDDRWGDKVPIVILIGADGRISWTDCSARIEHHWNEIPSVLEEAIELALAAAAEPAA